jgi:hypothetical protein
VKNRIQSLLFQIQLVPLQRGAFNPACAGVEGVAALEHGLLKAGLLF